MSRGQSDRENDKTLYGPYERKVLEPWRQRRSTIRRGSTGISTEGVEVVVCDERVTPGGTGVVSLTSGNRKKTTVEKNKGNQTRYKITRYGGWRTNSHQRKAILNKVLSVIKTTNEIGIVDPVTDRVTGTRTLGLWTQGCNGDGLRNWNLFRKLETRNQRNPESVLLVTPGISRCKNK